ncbi:MAG: hypothetical protein ABSF24_06660 [Candidatus Bathyarchaeia archaeon]
MKGDEECEEHQCEYLKWCVWHPEDCQGKPWDKRRVVDTIRNNRSRALTRIPHP